MITDRIALLKFAGQVGDEYIGEIMVVDGTLSFIGNTEACAQALIPALMLLSGEQTLTLEYSGVQYGIFDCTDCTLVTFEGMASDSMLKLLELGNVSVKHTSED
jgi:hypothetical protein